jgi:hypothetical protein
MPSISNDELERARPSISDDESRHSRHSVSDDELKSDDEMQSSMPSVSHDEELHKPLESSKLQQGLAAVTSYLVALFLHLLSYVKKWPLKLMGQHPLPGNRSSSPGNVNVNDPAAIGNGVAAAPHFMPSLQVRHLDIRNLNHIPNGLDNLGWEHLSSLPEINVDLHSWQYSFNELLQTELRRAPNHLTLNVKRAF